MTTKTGTRRRDGRVLADKTTVVRLQGLIQPYGRITSWEETRGRMYLGAYEFRFIVELILPDGFSSSDDREVRTELYLQAESVLEVLVRENFKVRMNSRIVLGGEGESSLEVCLVGLIMEG